MDRRAQRGGVALLAALLLLTLMAGAALATSRNLLRDLAVRDALNRGEEAAWAAEDGQERVLAALRAGGGGGEALRGFLRPLESASPGPAVPVPPALLAEPAAPGRCRIQVRHLGPLARPGEAPDASDPDPPGHLWWVQSAGIREAGTGPPFIQVRERLIVLPAGVAAGPAGLPGRAWRAVPGDGDPF